MYSSRTDITVHSTEACSFVRSFIFSLSLSLASIWHWGWDTLILPTYTASINDRIMEKPVNTHIDIFIFLYFLAFIHFSWQTHERMCLCVRVYRKRERAFERSLAATGHRHTFYHSLNAFRLDFLTLQVIAMGISTIYRRKIFFGDNIKHNGFEWIHVCSQILYIYTLIIL